MKTKICIHFAGIYLFLFFPQQMLYEFNKCVQHIGLSPDSIQNDDVSLLCDTTHSIMAPPNSFFWSSYLPQPYYPQFSTIGYLQWPVFLFLSYDIDQNQLHFSFPSRLFDSFDAMK